MRDVGVHHQQRAFTLIELLVVIAILAVLVSILIPSISKARESAGASLGAANQRSICFATQQYGADFNDKIPLYFSTGTSRFIQGPTGSPTLYNKRLYADLLIDGGYSDIKHFTDPGHPQWFTPNSAAVTWMLVPSQYPMISYLNNGFFYYSSMRQGIMGPNGTRNLRYSDLAAPSENCWIMDANFNNEPALFTSWDFSNYSPSYGNRRMPGILVSGYFDGHAERVPHGEIYARRNNPAPPASAWYWPSVPGDVPKFRRRHWDIIHLYPLGGTSTNLDANHASP